MKYGLILLLATLTATANWSGWRGSDGTGVSSETGVPLEWSATKNVKWKTQLPGRGHSSPIVWGNRVFLTTDIEGEVVTGAKAVEHKLGGQIFKHPDSIGADRKHTFKMLCFDRATGKLLWERTSYEGTVYDDRHRKGSYASPTPATDGTYVFAYFGTEGLYCYDFEGKQVWKTAPGQIALVGIDILLAPVGKGMRGAGAQQQPVVLGELHHRPPQVQDVGLRFLDVLADTGADLDHRLVHLRLDALVELALALGNDLGVDVRAQIEGERINGLVLLFDSDGE